MSNLSHGKSVERFKARREVLEVVRGNADPDSIIVNGLLVNVLTGEIYKSDVATKNGIIAAVEEDLRECSGNSTRIVDAKGLYLVPGLVDAHLHVESSMLRPSKFARLMARKGVTTIFYDPHEIANVSGISGLRWMVEELDNTALSCFLTIPSCIPATSSELETTGAQFGIEEIREALDWENVSALGEMMDFPGVLAGNNSTMEKLQITASHRLPIEGHASGLSGIQLGAYGAAGIDSDHEAVSKREALQRARRGFWTYLREGSGWADVKQGIKALTETEVDSRRFCLVTDDRDAIDLIEEGGVDHVVRRAIGEGIDPISAISMASINPATRFGKDNHLGSISPGRKADINMVKDLKSLEIEDTLIAGKPVNKYEWSTVSEPSLTETVKLGREVKSDTFNLKPEEREYAIKVHKKSIKTEKLKLSELDPKPEKLNYCAVLERHSGTENIGRAFVEGFSLKKGAIASTIAHDSHNLIVLGANKTDMACAVDQIVSFGGGQVVVESGKLKAGIKLPIVGLISNLSPKRVASSVVNVKNATRELGCRLSNPLMILSSLALAVIPEVRLTDKGLVDVNQQRLIH